MLLHTHIWTHLYTLIVVNNPNLMKGILPPILQEASVPCPKVTAEPLLSDPCLTGKFIVERRWVQVAPGLHRVLR